MTKELEEPAQNESPQTLAATTPSSTKTSEQPAPLKEGRATIPKVDGGLKKRTAIQNLTENLYNAVNIPPKNETITLLSKSTIPSLGVFYDYGTLIDKKKLDETYVEFKHFGPGIPMPEEIGEFKLDPSINLLNQKHFIIPMLTRSTEMGYLKVRVDSQGIFFYLDEADVTPESLAYYRRFFLSRDSILQRIATVIDELVYRNGGGQRTDIYRLKIRGQNLNHIRMTYPDVFNKTDMSRLRYELKKYYESLGFETNFYHDKNLEEVVVEGAEQSEPTVLKIFFSLKDVLPQLREYPIQFK